MRKKFLKAGISFLIVVLFLIQPLAIFWSRTAVNAYIGLNADDFLTRCYQVAFDRAPDEAGMEFWRKQLQDQKTEGAFVARDFIFSEEYLAQAASDEQYIRDLYEMFMGREPEQEGFDYWSQQIAVSSRESVFEGFANSGEFSALCCGYGIQAGFYTSAYPLEQVKNVNLFVDRMYRGTLGRIGDKDGQTYWVYGLLSGQLNGVSCAETFILGDEYKSLRRDFYGYINDLYRLFMGREGDGEGIQYWIDQLGYGYSREYAFEGFANSPEFDAICASYGIPRGFYQAAYKGESVAAKLSSISGVSGVERLNDSTMYGFKVEQPVDWNKPDGEKFQQTVSLNYAGYEMNTVYWVGGYSVDYPTSEISEEYNCNCVSMEYRFFGDSVPAGYDAKSAKYADQVTPDNAAKDFHHVIELVSQIFPQKRVFSGVSKGGEVTNYQAYRFPGDADVFVAYCAPLYKEVSAPGLGDYLFNKVGDDRYGKEEAKKIRDTLLDFELAHFEAREQIRDALLMYRGYTPSYLEKSGIDADKLFDFDVYLIAFSAWKYTSFDQMMYDIVDKYRKGDESYIEDLLEYYSPDPEQETARNEFEQEPSTFNCNFDIDCIRNFGGYRMEFKPLRDALKAKGSSAYIAFTEEDEKDLWNFKYELSEEVIKAIEDDYDTTLYSRMIEWTHKTQVPVIELYGSSDSFTVFMIPPVDDNPNFHVFVGKYEDHSATFADSEVWPDVCEVLDPIIG